MSPQHRIGSPVLALLVVLAVLAVAACGGDADADSTTQPTAATSLATSSTVALSTTTAAATTTVAPPSTTAPPTGGVDLPELFLTVTDPGNGQVVDSEWYVFRGTTLPGAIVLAAGDIVVPVAADGSWQIRLRLQPGSNLATIVAEDEMGRRVIAQVQVVFEVPGGDDPPIVSP